MKTNAAAAIDSRLEGTFWYMAHERYAMTVRRSQGQRPPWTTDAVLRDHRFTSVFRAQDRVSQYLIKEVQYGGWPYPQLDQAPQEVLFRTILFKLFNQIETWELLCRELGEIPNISTFDVTRYSRILSAAIERGMKIWNNAYMVTPPPEIYGGAKHEGWLNRLQTMLSDGIFELAPRWTLQELYSAFLEYPTVGQFFAMQWTIDCNYSLVVNQDENTFIVPGPGAIRGVRKLTRSQGDAHEVITFLTEHQDVRQRERGLSPLRLQGLRPLHLIDVQSLFCEFDKYTRVAIPSLDAGGSLYKRIKQTYDANEGQTHADIGYFYPPKWGLPGGMAI